MATRTPLLPNAPVAIACLGLLVFLIFSIVKVCTRRSSRWIISAVITAVAFTLLIVACVLNMKPRATGPYGEDLNNPRQAYQIRSQDGAVSLVIPGYWDELPKSHAQAILSAGHRGRDQYLMVVPTSKIDYVGNLQSFDEITIKSMQERVPGAVISEPESLTLGGCPAIRRRIEAVVQQQRVVYISTQVETKDSFCQVLGWAPKSREVTYMPVLQTVSDSFTGTPPE